MKPQNKQAEVDFFTRNKVRSYDYLYFLLYCVYLRLTAHCTLVRGRMLEAGCADGRSGRYFMGRFPELTNVVGVDICPAHIELSNDYTMVCGDLEDRSLFRKGSFDTVLCNSVLHHFPSLRRVVSNLSWWLKPGGTFILIDVNGSNLVNWMGYKIRGCFNPETLIKYNLATPNETNHTHKDYLDQCARHGLKLEFMEGIFHVSRAQGIMAVKMFMYRALRFVLPTSIYSAPVVLGVFRKI